MDRDVKKQNAVNADPFVMGITTHLTVRMLRATDKRTDS